MTLDDRIGSATANIVSHGGGDRVLVCKCRVAMFWFQ